MQYKKIKLGDTTIEFHNNWMGEETVLVNGRVVSKKSSLWGTNHFFTVVEDGKAARYILTTKVNEGMQVALDLSKNGELIEDNIPVHSGSMAGPKKNKPKKLGMAKLQEYELEDSLELFDKALEIEDNDPEVYFHMACAYSVLEETEKGFDSLKKAVEYGLQDTEKILNHDMLAYLRMREEFEGFLNSGFTEYK